VWRAATGFRLNAAPRDTVRLLADGALREARLTGAQALSTWPVEGGVVMVERGWPHLIAPARASGVAGDAAGDGAILAPMPGRITAVEVEAGQRVAKGQRLVTLEAMKMEHALTAPFDAEVAELAAVTGSQVSEGALLVKLAPV
jgi:3-methylcrotonyl-CoA carboxylase alpha subunit